MGPGCFRRASWHEVRDCWAVRAGPSCADKRRWWARAVIAAACCVGYALIPSPSNLRTHRHQTSGLGESRCPAVSHRTATRRWPTADPRGVRRNARGLDVLRRRRRSIQVHGRNGTCEVRVPASAGPGWPAGHPAMRRGRAWRTSQARQCAAFNQNTWSRCETIAMGGGDRRSPRLPKAVKTSRCSYHSSRWAGRDARRAVAVAVKTLAGVPG
jgi:hypothetical protein